MLTTSALCTAALLAFGVPAQAQQIIDNKTETVIGTGGGTQASPWDIGGLFVGNVGTGTLTISDGGEVSNAGEGYIGFDSGSTGTVTVDGAGSTWTNTEDLFVGNSGTATLNITNGGTVINEFGFVGSDATANGAVTVNGTGSTWTNNGNLLIGRNGTGTLAIENGGEVSNNTGVIGSETGSEGAVIVDGTGSTWSNSQEIRIGRAGSGTLTISNGGTVSAAGGSGAARIGYINGSTGTLNIGAAAGETAAAAGTLDAANLIFGDGNGTLNFNHTEDSYGFAADISGSGTINHLSGLTNLTGDSSGFTGITNANGANRPLVVTGQLGGSAGYIGGGGGLTGAVTVFGTGASWTASNLVVGESGTGTLLINNGGTVSNDIAYIGYSSGATGTATVTGTDSSWTNSTGFLIGLEGTGTLDILAGATVTAGDDSFIGDRAGSNGTMNVSGVDSSFEAGSNNIYVGNEGTGTLNIENRGTVSNGSGYIGYEAGISGTVSVDGAGSKWTNLSTVFIGFNGNGTLNALDGGGITALDHILLGSHDNGSGTLNALDGGEITALNDIILGSYATGTGTATVSGTGSRLQSTGGIVTVGLSGTGTLTIENGGAVSGKSGTIASLAGSAGTVTVTGAGSSWTSAGNIIVGRQGQGTLNILDRGAVTATTDVLLGDINAGNGTATISGSGSKLEMSGVFAVGNVAVGTLTIADGGTVSNNGGGASRIGLSLNTTGTATVTGAGSAWVNTGTLDVGYFGNGTLTIADGGVVSNTGSGIVTLGSFASGTGTLNIGAAAGETAAGAGTLDAAALTFGAGTGMLNFNHTETAYAFSSDITGAGTINHIAGVTKLTGDNSGFSGTTDVSGGRLYVNNALGGTVNVTGGTLGGSGTLGTVAIASGGAIAPGNSIGTLNVGNITIAADSTYEVEVNSAGQSDLINATGTATINGGTVSVVPFPDYALDTAYTIVTAAGGVTGTFDTASFGTGALFITPTLTYDANNAFVTLAQTAGFASVATTPNQIAAAGGADSLGSGNAIWNAIANLNDAGQARAAFDALSGEIHASAKTALIEDSRFVRDATRDRLRAAFAGVGANAADHAEKRVSDAFAFWGQGFGSWSRWNGDGNAAAMSRDIGGLLIGGDAEIADNVRLGLMGGYARSSLGVAGRMSSAMADSYTLGVYGGGRWDAFSLKGGLAHSWHSLATSRSVAFTGFSDSLSASYSARTLQAWGEAAYSFETGAARFEPFANLAYVNLSTDGFTETGGAAALTAASNVVDATFTTLGLRAETDVALGDMEATLRGMVGWRHAFGGAPASQMTFASSGDAFTIAGVPLAQDSLVLDVGFDVNLTDNATLGFAYGGQFGSGISDHDARANLNVRF